ncbi:Yip1 domain protein [Cooperia oncophora]
MFGSDPVGTGCRTILPRRNGVSECELVTETSDSISASGRKSNFFSLEFYQQFFDVETDQVLKRVLHSVVPTTSNFILDYVHPMPDLWGPFWISVTLVFSIGVFGNIAQYIQNDGSPGEYGSDFRLDVIVKIYHCVKVVYHHNDCYVASSNPKVQHSDGFSRTLYIFGNVGVPVRRGNPSYSVSYFMATESGNAICSI